MDDEELGFEDLGVQFSDVVASLEDLGSGHWSDEDLWILAATPASELTAGQREFLRDHVLRCRLCYQALGHFRRADSMTIEVPSMPVALRAELLATWTSWQAQRIVFAIMVLAGGILRVRQLPFGGAFRFRTVATEFDAVESAPGNPAELPVRFGDVLLLLVITAAPSSVGHFNVRLKADEATDTAELEPLECLLIDSAGQVLDSAQFSMSGFAFTRHDALTPGIHKVVLRTKVDGEVIGEVELVRDPDNPPPGAAKT